MHQRLFVHIPAQLFGARLNFLLNRKLQPEIACQEISIAKLDLGQMREFAAQLADQGLATCLHAPFNGFEPGSGKSRVQKRSAQICRQSLQLAEALGARRIIFHPGLVYGSRPKETAAWLENSLQFWPEYVHQAQELDTCLCMENIFETNPEPLFELLQGIASETFGHCFDIGHWNMFHSGRLNDWLNMMAPYLRHLHLHDNHGAQDEHLPIGQGDVCFSSLFSWLKTSACKPTMTLEAHKLSDLDLSLQAIAPQLTNP